MAHYPRTIQTGNHKEDSRQTISLGKFLNSTGIRSIKAPRNQIGPNTVDEEHIRINVYLNGKDSHLIIEVLEEEPHIMVNHSRVGNSSMPIQ